jgi:hypothetical protein
MKDGDILCSRDENVIFETKDYVCLCLSSLYYSVDVESLNSSVSYLLS